MNINDYLNRHGDRIFPYLFAATLPWLSILNTVPFRRSISVIDIAVQWIFGFVFLLLLWFVVNRIISVQNTISLSIRLFIALFAVVVIGTATVFLVSEAVPYVNDDQPLWIASFRLSIGGLIVVAIQGSFRAIRENEKLKTENFALQTENYKAQLAQLKNQINPHFLFNSLSTLLTLVKKDASKSEEFVHGLSDVYRELLNARESNMTTLQDELHFLNTYLYLLQTRHEKGLEVKIEVDKDNLNLRLPSFALQLLVENCTKHNIISKDSPLRISIRQLTDNKVVVINNLQRKKKVESMGVGLKNLGKRYSLLGIENGLIVKENESEFEVVLTLF